MLLVKSTYIVVFMILMIVIDLLIEMILMIVVDLSLAQGVFSAGARPPVPPLGEHGSLQGLLQGRHKRRLHEAARVCHRSGVRGARMAHGQPVESPDPCGHDEGGGDRKRKRLLFLPNVCIRYLIALCNSAFLLSAELHKKRGIPGVVSSSSGDADAERLR